jgi:hypothetical protein
MMLMGIERISIIHPCRFYPEVYHDRFGPTDFDWRHEQI